MVTWDALGIYVIRIPGILGERLTFAAVGVSRKPWLSEGPMKPAKPLGAGAQNCTCVPQVLLIWGGESFGLLG